IVHIDFATFENELKRRVGAPFQEHAAAMLCELHDGTPISPGQALALAMEGHVRRLVFDTPDERTKFGREARFFTGGLRLMVEARDRHCTGPGCGTPSDQCHIDHLLDWQHDGETEGDNGDCKCPWHNIHKSKYVITTDAITGRTRWRRRE
ncbi:MAG: HNH endonuclease signature motif containing protein, partial [Acidimicrobiia bacterium]